MDLSQLDAPVANPGSSKELSLDQEDLLARLSLLSGAGAEQNATEQGKSDIAVYQLLQKCGITLHVRFH